MKRLITSLFGLAVMTAFAASTALAADGTLGADSTGSATLEVTIPALVQVSNIQDWQTTATYTGSSFNNLDSAARTFCVYSNQDANGSYKIKFTCTNPDGACAAFSLAHAANTFTVPYTVYFTNATAAVGNVTDMYTANYGLTLGAVTGANTSQYTCGGSANAQYRITISSANLDDVPQGMYSGTLYLTVYPD